MSLNPSVTSTTVQVSAGRVLSGTFIGGELNLWAPTSSTLAYVFHTRIFSGGTLYVSNNAVASDTVMMGGTIDVKSGGKIWTTVLSSGGTKNVIYVSSGGSALGNKIYSGASLNLQSGAYAQTNSIFAGGEMRMTDNGSARYNYIDGGSFYVGGGAVSSSLIYAGGSMRIAYASASETFVSSGGSLDANTSAKLTDTKVSSGGSMTVTNGSADILTIGRFGAVTINNGGKATSVTIDGGALDLKARAPIPPRAQPPSQSVREAWPFPVSASRHPPRSITAAA